MKKSVIFILISIIMITGTIFAGDKVLNKYEQKFIGMWEDSVNPELLIFEVKDGDKIFNMRTLDSSENITEDGRWFADAKKITMMLNYNKKDYKMVNGYKFINPDKIEVTLLELYENNEPKSSMEGYEIGSKSTIVRYEEY